MVIDKLNVDALLITGAKALDPVRVIIEDIEPGKGRIVIVCFDRAWTGYWGGMGKSSNIRRFWMENSSDYLLDTLMAGLPRRKSPEHKTDAAYLTRIIEAVQQAFREGR